MRSFLLFILVLATCRSTAQDTILLMSGHTIDAKVLGQSTLEVRYLEEKNNGKILERAEPTENVFSVKDSLGQERIWYFHDTVFGNDLTIDQMRWFIKGEQDARKGYKPLWPVLGGFVVGAGATIAFNLEVNSLAIPPLYAATMALPRVHVTRGSITDPLMEGDEFYAMGYAKVGRSKRVVRSLIATFAGVAVGLAVRQLIINPGLPPITD
jgi:hypothetical protein